MCKLKLAQEVSGATQAIRRLLDSDRAELVWIIRAIRGWGVVRDEYEERKSARVSVRRNVRGAPGAPDSSDQWPGVKAAGRPARVPPAAVAVATVATSTSPWRRLLLV